jgi:hypothetical protein
LSVNVFEHFPRAPNQRIIGREIEKMDAGIRQLDAAELDIVAGGNGWDVAKIWVAATLSAIGGGPIGAAFCATAVIAIQAAHNDPYVPDCSGTTGGCDSGTMQD